jgi:AAA domain (dynein-related subfamily)
MTTFRIHPDDQKHKNGDDVVDNITAMVAFKHEQRPMLVTSSIIETLKTVIPIRGVKRALGEPKRDSASASDSNDEELETRLSLLSFWSINDRSLICRTKRRIPYAVCSITLDENTDSLFTGAHIIQRIDIKQVLSKSTGKVVSQRFEATDLKLVVGEDIRVLPKYCIVFDAKRKLLLCNAGSKHQCIKVWATNTLTCNQVRQPIRTLQVDGLEFDCLMLSQDSTTLYAVTNVKSIAVWDISCDESGTVVYEHIADCKVPGTPPHYLFTLGSCGIVGCCSQDGKICYWKQGDLKNSDHASPYSLLDLEIEHSKITHVAANSAFDALVYTTEGQNVHLCSISKFKLNHFNARRRNLAQQAPQILNASDENPEQTNTKEIEISNTPRNVYIVPINSSIPLAPTSASRALDDLLWKLTKTPWQPDSPIVVGLFGEPGVGKNVLVRQFARQLYQHLSSGTGLAGQNFSKSHFNRDFYFEHNFSLFVKDHSISKLMGAVRDHKGGEGDMVKQLRTGHVFCLDEFNLAHDSVIRAFGSLFEDGVLEDNSGTHEQCRQPSVFFILGNPRTEMQRSALRMLLCNDDGASSFYDIQNQEEIEDPKLFQKFEKFGRAMFADGLEFIGDRCYTTLLQYAPPDDPVYHRLIVLKYLQLAVAQLTSQRYVRLRTAWTCEVTDACVETLKLQHVSNRRCRSLIMRGVLKAWPHSEADSIALDRRLRCDDVKLQEPLLILDVKDTCQPLSLHFKFLTVDMPVDILSSIDGKEVVAESTTTAINQPAHATDQSSKMPNFYTTELHQVPFNNATDDNELDGVSIFLSLLAMLIFVALVF